MPMGTDPTAVKPLSAGPLITKPTIRLYISAEGGAEAQEGVTASAPVAAQITELTTAEGPQRGIETT